MRCRSVGDIQERKIKSPHHINHPDIDPSKKNFTEYQHLWKDTVPPTQSQIDWTINLREYPKKIKHRRKTSEGIDEEENSAANKTFLGPPSFYLNDLDKYINRFQTQKPKKNFLNPNASDYQEKQSQRNLINFLIKSKFDQPITIQKINYITSLRNYTKNYSHFFNPKQWDNHTAVKNPNYIHLEPQTKDKEKLIMRPYEIVRDEVMINGNNIKRRKFVRCKSEAEIWVGEHITRPKFSENYCEKNYAKIENLLNKNRYKVSEINFISGFRNANAAIINNEGKPKHPLKGQGIKTNKHQ